MTFLTGMAIGNGYTDPEHMLNYGDYLYQVGLIDAPTRNFFKVKEDEGLQYIKNKEWDKAFLV
jgi:vitellogenic carboxypeptidase-like protein